MTNRTTPPSFPLPLETTMMVDYLTTICVLLENSDEMKEYDGVHTFDTEPDIFAIKNAVMFCTRGMYPCMKSCEPIQKELKFKKINDTRYIKRHLFLHKWPFPHSIKKNDQLSGITTFLRSTAVEGISDQPTNIDEAPCICQQDYTDQQSLYQIWSPPICTNRPTEAS